jgi:hypothetical protein
LILAYALQFMCSGEVSTQTRLLQTLTMVDSRDPAV